MSAQHRDPEYQKNARIIKQQVSAARKRGRDVTCWRCGGEIDPEQQFDVGHMDPTGGHALANLAPEHRGENRRAGGRQGAAVMHRRKARATRMLPW